MLVRVGTTVGAVSGWTLAVLTWLAPSVPYEDTVPAMLLCLSVALLCSACLVLQRHQRPLGAAFEMGYDQGRKDAIRDATVRAGNVSPMRRTTRTLCDMDAAGG